ncbi:unnamed protein product [Malus baccata var. baccata]
MMVMASNSDEYAVVGKLRYGEFWLEDKSSNASTNLMQGIMEFPKHFLMVRLMVENADIAGGKSCQAIFRVETICGKGDPDPSVANIVGRKDSCALFQAVGGKGSGDVEDMFIDNVGRGSSSVGLDSSNGARNVEHRNSKHVNENDIGNEDDGVLESCRGKLN